MGPIHSDNEYNQTQDSEVQETGQVAMARLLFLMPPPGLADPLRVTWLHGEGQHQAHGMLLILSLFLS